MADFLVLLYVVFAFVFVTLPGILCQVWCLIVSIPDLCLLPYFGVCERSLDFIDLYLYSVYMYH